MAITKLALLRLMSGWPVVGKKIKATLAEQLLVKLEEVEKGFASPTTRFSTNIHFLYDSLEGFDYTLKEDFGEYNSLRLITYTKTSGEAYKLLERLRGIGGPKVEDYFKDTIKDTPGAFLDWYSNKTSFEGFISSSVMLLGIYAKMNARTNDGHVYTATELAVSYSTQEFLSGKYFKLLVLDLIEALRIVLHLEVKSIHERDRT